MDPALQGLRAYARTKQKTILRGHKWPLFYKTCRALLDRAGEGARLHMVCRVTPFYFPTHWSTQSFTVLYQSWEFCGFSTQ